jgi:hypothetical protein
MRVTLSELRDIRRKGVQWRPPERNAPIVVPSAVRKKAIRVFHDESHADALAYLDGRRPDGSRGLSGTFGPKGSRAKQGQRVRDAFGRYVRLDRQDSRPVAEVSLLGEISIGAHSVMAAVDVVIFATAGYSGRILNWDRAGVTDEIADALSVPGVLLIDQELGDDTCVDVEVWDLEGGKKWVVTREAAMTQISEVARLLDRVEAAVWQ